MQKINPTQSTPMKITAFILFVIFACIIAGSVVGSAIMIDGDFYTKTEAQFKEEFFKDVATSRADDALSTFLNQGKAALSNEYDDTNFSFFISDGEKTLYGSQKSSSQYYGGQREIPGSHISYSEPVPTPSDVLEQTEGLENPQEGEQTPSETVFTVGAYINKSFAQNDYLKTLDRLLGTAYSLRFWIYIIAFMSLVACGVLFAYLMCAAGHKPGDDEIHPGIMTKVPFDILTAACVAAVTFGVYVCMEWGYYGSGALIVLTIGCCSVFGLCVFLGWSISFATRVKMGRWWRNTLICAVLLLSWRIVKKIVLWIWGLIKKVFAGAAHLVRNLPLIWKSMLFMAVLAIASLIVIMSYSEGMRMTGWLFGMIILVVIVGYSAIALRKLQAAGQRLAKGDLSVQVDTKYMLWDFKEHGENLNSISLGMTRAVDERLKSERLKTELITNVSHDIKTPLTSIINYVDLISKEDCENEKITEYTEVLKRQSERLKKLIVDLVEASKASTGNMEVNLAPCDVSVLLAQSLGEYEAKLKECELETVVSKPKESAMIMADGRLMWRVFDNLLNNVCKYTMPNTRVYIDTETSGEETVISFKNVSKYPLNITAEELMERFVRGDSSRHTEGSGLGLSIAKSLSELMSGKLKLTIDGDLFKAELRFKSVVVV